VRGVLLRAKAGSWSTRADRGAKGSTTVQEIYVKEGMGQWRRTKYKLIGDFEK
jgi:hypothetical protein